MDEASLWAAAVAVSAALAIWGHHPKRMPLHWLFKPLPALLLILAVCSRTPAGATRWWFIAALTLSLVGDVVLMLPRSLFIAGLASFLVALLAYAIGFSLDTPISAGQLGWIIIPLSVAACVIRILWPHLGAIRPAVLVYICVMVILVWRMLARVDAPEVSIASYSWGIAGGLSFMCSDSLLALRRFAQWPIPYAIELGPYFVAQWCLAAATWS